MDTAQEEVEDGEGVEELELCYTPAVLIGSQQVMRLQLLLYDLITLILYPVLAPHVSCYRRMYPVSRANAAYILYRAGESGLLARSPPQAGGGARAAAEAAQCGAGGGRGGDGRP